MIFDSIPAYAKINLFLNVTGKRKDGYHTIESAFVFINLADLLSFELTSKSIERTGDLCSDPQHDLCVKAAQLLRENFPGSYGVKIHVKKIIPVGAGLGGGSSDAATTLLVLNKLWNLNLSEEKLCEIGLSIGADVPFFIQGKNAFVSGIGEILQPFEFPETSFEILFPNSSQDTASVYRHPSLDISEKKISYNIFTQAVKANSWFSYLSNDLEKPARLLNPNIQHLLNLFPYFHMTGSGSAAFCPTIQILDKDFMRKIPISWLHFSTKSLKIRPII